MDGLTPDTVSSLLRDSATRAATLEALEKASFDRTISLAACPALSELLAADAREVGRDEFDRVGLLLGRLAAGAPDDPSSVYGAALGEGRYAAFLRSEGSVLAQAVGKPASELVLADARSFACAYSITPPSMVKGYTKALSAAGFATTADYFAIYMTEEWFCK